MKIRPLHCIDLYKTQHINFYDQGLSWIYENSTPRSAKYMPKVEGIDDKIVLFGNQYLVKWYLMEVWNKSFFQLPKEQVIAEYKRRMDSCLGAGNYPTHHFEALHDLGYLPILIKSLPEGSVVNAGIPYFTIQNTHPNFAWLPGFLEDAMSNLIWRASTSATISRKYRLIAEHFAKQTTDDSSYVDFFFHDFQLRSTGGIQDAMLSGSGHLISFKGSDNTPAMDFLEDYYNADPTREIIGAGVVANEHSTVCVGGKDKEFDNYKKWITVTFPKGIISLVSDTWNLWNVITNHLAKLKGEILARDGKVVIRPDSSPKTPLEIICGDPEAPEGTPENKGAIQLLWEIFGGKVNNKGFKELDPHIGLIYGEGISIPLLIKIYKRLAELGFAANNVVFGIGGGSFLYGMTRDTLGWACKATACVVNGEFREIYKDPITDSGMKKSAKGLLRVDKINGEFVLKDQCSEEEERGGELKPVFLNGKILKDWTLQEVRDNLAQYR
jgi:nicotinamide phosphoribosyltransferase